MKLLSAVVFLSVSVMVVMIYQAARQELNLRNLKAHMLQNSEEVKRKEAAIVQIKVKIQELNKALWPLKTTKDGLIKQKQQSVKAAQDLDKSLTTCNTEKEEAAKKKTGLTETIVKLKAEQEEGKKKAEGEIQSLKQQILDRDKALCAFVDVTNVEGRKLCGISEAPK